MDRHVWEVTLRHSEQGFQKIKQVDATGFSQAVTFAGDALSKEGYNRYEFEVTSLRRLQFVARAPERV